MDRYRAFEDASVAEQLRLLKEQRDVAHQALDQAISSHDRAAASLARVALDQVAAAIAKLAHPGDRRQKKRQA